MTSPIGAGRPEGESTVLDVFNTRKWGAQALKRMQADRVRKAG